MFVKAIVKYLIITVVALSAAYAAYYYYIAQLLFKDSLYVVKDTREFNLLISRALKIMPVMEGAASGSVKYRYGGGDGNNPQSDSLEFFIQAPVADVLQYYTRYFQSKGYASRQQRNGSPNNVMFGNGIEVFNVNVKPTSPENRVTIYHLQALEA